MARLSSLSGDYSRAGNIIDRRQMISVGGETEYELSFIDGSEEVYLDGERAYKGASADYTTGEGKIILTTPLVAGTKVILIGRASANEIPYNKAVGESTVLSDGQTEVIFTSIGTEAIEIYVSGPLVDRGRLTSPQDFELKANTTNAITLNQTFPAGTVLEGVQGGRLAWVDSDNMVVNDGTASKSLSARFRDTQESKAYFIETNGVQLQDLVVGMDLKQWRVDNYTGIPYEDSTGAYPILKLGKSYWSPQIVGRELTYIVTSWTTQGNQMVITALASNGVTAELKYSRRTPSDTEENTSVDYGSIQEDVYDSLDDGGL